MSSETSEPKIGAGHASAMARLGLAELRAAFVFSESNVTQPAPYGLYGTKTPGEVQDERKASARDSDDQQSPSVFGGRLEDWGGGSKESDREPPQQERE
jgi:hypothetical protein